MATSLAFTFVGALSSSDEDGDSLAASQTTEPLEDNLEDPVAEEETKDE